MGEVIARVILVSHDCERIEDFCIVSHQEEYAA